MAKEYDYPKWIEKAWIDNLFQLNAETDSWKYNNPKYKRNYKFEFNPKKDHKIKKGDTICFGGRSYRNEGVWIWDGNKIINLDDSIDDYGSVPSLFKVGNEFKPNHWIDIIDHNSIIWLEDELLEKIEIKNSIIIKDDYLYVKGTVVIFNETYNINITIWKNKIPDITVEKIKKFIIDTKPSFDYENETNISLNL